jgi:hypothetical protein
MTGGGYITFENFWLDMVGAFIYGAAITALVFLLIGPIRLTRRHR